MNYARTITRTGKWARLNSLVFGVFAFIWTWLCLASAYADIDNTARATGTFNSSVVQSNPVTVSVPLTPANKKIAIQKKFVSIVDTNGNSAQDAGDTINYSFIVTNTGNVTLTNINVTDGNATVAGGPITLAPGAIDNTTFTATHLITLADLLALGVDNQATVTATPPSGADINDLSHPSSNTLDGLTHTTLNPFANVALKKTVANIIDVNSNGIQDANDEVHYAFEIKNTGTLALTNVTVTDTNATIVGSPISVAVGAIDTTSFTGVHILTQADVNAGFVDNRALVTASPPAGPNITDQSHPTSFTADADTHATLTTAVKMTLDKLLVAVVDVNSNGRTDVNDRIDYKFTVTNTGAVALTNVTITDPQATVTGGPISLAIGASDSTSFTASHVLTQADIDTGHFENTAKATANGPGASTAEAEDTLDTPFTVLSSITLDKQGVLVGAGHAGDTINYSFIVKNTGDTTLTNVRIDDPFLSAGLMTRDPRAVSMMASAQKTDPITTATIAAPKLPPTLQDYLQLPLVVPLDRFTPTHLMGLRGAVYAERDSVLMTGDSNAPKVGDELGIVFRVTNAGDVPLTNINVTQSGTRAFTDKLEILAPNASDIGSFLLIHQLTQADIKSGRVETPAVVTAEARGAKVTFDVAAPIALIELETFDEVATATITPSSTTLTPGQTFTFNSSHILTQAEVDAGTVHNDAEAIGDKAVGDVRATDSVDVTITAVPGIALVKTASLDLGTDGTATVGDTITYSFAVTNTGNVTLSNITVTDLLPLITVNGSLATLAPGDTDATSFSATYALTQTDIDAGKVENQAEASGTPPVGAVVKDLSDDDKITEDDKTIVTLIADPSVTLLKQATLPQDTNANGILDVGDTIDYTFTVTNTGNVTLTGFTITDTLLPSNTVVPVVGTLMSLDPGETDSATFTAQVVLDQALIDSGVVTNTAQVSATPPNAAPPVTDDSHPDDPLSDQPTVVELERLSGITLLKTVASVDDVNNNSVDDLGDIVHYAFTVANTGNVTLTNVIVTDSNAAVNGAAITLLPGTSDSTTFTAQHTISPTDVTEGQVINLATASGNPPEGDPISDESHPTDPAQDTPTILAVSTTPSIAVVKQLDSIADDNNNGITDAGDIITYKFIVTNTGNTRLNNITLTELLTGATITPTSLLTLAPGTSDSTTFTATYVVTLTDVVDGRVENSVRADAVTASNQPVKDLSDESLNTEDDPTIVDIPNDPSVALVKTISGVTDGTNPGNLVGIRDPGDVIHYAFTVTNTGNLPLSNVMVSDANATVMPLAPLASLGVGDSDSTYFTATHVITSQDVANSGVENTAEVTAESPLSSGSVNASSNTVTSLITPTSRIAVVLRIASVTDTNGNGINDPGDIINYEVSVENTGNVDLNNVYVYLQPNPTNPTPDLTNPLPGGPISLAAGMLNNTSFSLTHVITPADGVAGTVSKRLFATGDGVLANDAQDFSDNQLNSANNPTVLNVVLTPPNLTKVAGRTQVKRGDVVPYTIRATNVQGVQYMIRDIMPPGFQYVTGSATVNGAPQEPGISGRTLTFASIVPASAKIEIKLNLIAGVSTTTGRYVNKAEIVDTGPSSDGNVAARAEAAVMIKEEHVFDCSDIIGRVFDDRNHNGYADDGEPGMPGVRVVSVNGRVITTDEHGRFSVPCADIPNPQIGSNYILKLDPRSLPQGYTLTTENPRMVRVTRGKVTKLNFGVAGSRNIEVDVKKDAFITDGLDLKPKWADGLDRLVQILEENRGNVTVIYRCGVYAPIADARLEKVQQEIASRWEAAGAPYRLKIDARVECGK